MNISQIKQVLESLTQEDRSNLMKVFVSYFLVLFTYPLFRATTTAIYIQTFGAKATPKVWFLSVVFLSITITVFNLLQKKFRVQILFLITSIVSVLIFGISDFLLQSGFSELAYVLYIWKEIYIVMVIHMILGYVNNDLNIDRAKILLGPIGAMGSIGGILGGVLTSYWVKSYSTSIVIAIACVALILNAIFFFSTRILQNVEEEKKIQKVSPISSLKDVKVYVLLICLVVTLSQFCINIANLQFNLMFEQIVPDVSEKASYLARLFSAINVVTLIVQLIIIPPLFAKSKMKTIHLFIPVFYMFLSFIGLGLGGGLLISVAGTFVLFKGLDYSLFSSSKELLYYSLSPLQKFGAKYLSDMVVYRLAKALISILLIYVQDLMILNVLIFIFLLGWIFSVFKIFKNNSEEAGVNS